MQAHALGLPVPVGESRGGGRVERGDTIQFDMRSLPRTECGYRVRVERRHAIEPKLRARPRCKACGACRLKSGDAVELKYPAAFPRTERRGGIRIQRGDAVKIQCTTLPACQRFGGLRRKGEQSVEVQQPAGPCRERSSAVCAKLSVLQLASDGAGLRTAKPAKRLSRRPRGLLHQARAPAHAPVSRKRMNAKPLVMGFRVRCGSEPVGRFDSSVCERRKAPFYADSSATLCAGRIGAERQQPRSRFVAGLAAGALSKSCHDSIARLTGAVAQRDHPFVLVAGTLSLSPLATGLSALSALARFVASARHVSSKFAHCCNSSRRSASHCIRA